MACTEHLSCRLAKYTTADAHSAQHQGPGGDDYYAVMVGTEVIAHIRVADGWHSPHWSATAGGNAIPLPSAAEHDFEKAQTAAASYALDAAFHMRMALHG